MIKKIAYILTNYSTQPDGISIYSENLLYELINKKNLKTEIYVLKKNKTFLTNRLKINNRINLENIKIVSINSRYRLFFLIYLNLILNIKKYDFVLFPSLIPVIIIRNKSIKIIHDYTYKKYNKSLTFYQRIYKKTLQYFLVFENYIGYISKTTLKDIDEFGYNVLRNKKKIYIPNSLSKNFQNSDINMEKNKNITFLYIGSKNYHKGFDTSIKFINDFKSKYSQHHVTAYFAGKKKFDTQIILNKIKLNKSVNFVFYDYVDDNLLLDLYSKSHFLLFLSKNEGYGLPILESIKCNCIPILSNLEIFKEILEKDNYELFLDKYNLNDVYARINEIYKNNRLSVRLQQSLNKILDKNIKNFRIYIDNFIKVI